MPESKPPPPDVIPETYESVAAFSSDDPTFKFYQVAVPSFAFNETGDQTGVTRTVPNVSGDPPAGSSFLRLGSFPDVTQPTKGPAGFGASLALANLVGDATGIVGAESPDASPSTFNGDPNYLLGFTNDTRAQETPLGPNQGQAETVVLLTKGGWWDHSDGNRITTTSGDKIEIIRGNYKMVVVGRQPDISPSNVAENGVINDISGGWQVEQGPSPDLNIKTIEWTQDEGGTWSVYENNGLGNVYTSFYGEIGELYVGPVKETWTGQAPDGFPKSAFYTNSQTQRGAEGLPTSGPETVITDYTWAESITTYTGSEQKPVPTITENVFANSLTCNAGSAAKRIHTRTETAYLGSSTSTTDALSITETTTVAGAVTQTTKTATTTETITSGAITQTIASGAITELTTVGAKTALTVAGAINEVTLVGEKADIVVGALLLDLQVAAAKMEIFIGGRLAIDLGGAIEIALPDKLHIEVPDKTEMRLNKIETDLEHTTLSMNRADVALHRQINALIVELGL